MHRPNVDLGDRGYNPAHMTEVLNEMRRQFPGYFAKFLRKPGTAGFDEAIAAFEGEQQKYVEFLDVRSLHEFEDDPGAFKSEMKRKCPIIRRCLLSNEQEMEQYKIKFNLATGQELLQVTQNIAKFGRKHVKRFEQQGHERIKTVDSLGLADLLEEDYVAYGVIGGGIRSHFLYSLYPHVFPNRSQSAVWALYFLTNKKDFGFADASEFLMIDVEKGTTQQNYHYPYDLFSFYALKLYLMMKDALLQKRYNLNSSLRYIYLDTFLERIAQIHQTDINLLKRKEYEYTE